MWLPDGAASNPSCLRGDGWCRSDFRTSHPALDHEDGGNFRSARGRQGSPMSETSRGGVGRPVVAHRGAAPVGLGADQDMPAPQGTRPALRRARGGGRGRGGRRVLLLGWDGADGPLGVALDDAGLDELTDVARRAASSPPVPQECQPAAHPTEAYLSSFRDFLPILACCAASKRLRRQRMPNPGGRVGILCWHSVGAALERGQGLWQADGAKRRRRRGRPPASRARRGGVQRQAMGRTPDDTIARRWFRGRRALTRTGGQASPARHEMRVPDDSRALPRRRPWAPEGFGGQVRRPPPRVPRSRPGGGSGLRPGPWRQVACPAGRSTRHPQRRGAPSCPLRVSKARPLAVSVVSRSRAWPAAGGAF